MIIAEQLIASLRNRDIELRLEGNELRYRAPNGSMTPEDINSLKALKPEIIEFLKAETGPGLTPLIPQARSGTMPLMHSQQTWWFLQQFGAVQGNELNVCRAMRFNFNLDVSILARCFGEITSRQESLRSRVFDISGMPAQLISSKERPHFQEFDLTELPADSRENEARQIVERLAYRPLDPLVDPVLKVAVLKLSARDFILLVVLQHLMADALSMANLIGELFTLYDAFDHGLPSPLPPLPLQCADYALWQRANFDSILAKQLPYWKAKVADSKPLLMPTDNPRPAEKDFNAALIPFEISTATTTSLAQLAKKERCTLFTVLLTAYKVMLQRWSGQHDILISTPFAGRIRPETIPLVGCFLTTLALRNDLSGNPRFTQLMRHVSQSTLEAYTHADVEILMLSHLLQMEFSAISINFNEESTLLNSPGSSQGEHAAPKGIAHNAASFPLEPHKHWSKYPAEFGLEIFLDRHGRLMCYLMYARELFRAETIQRFIDEYCALLQQILLNPDANIDDYKP